MITMVVLVATLNSAAHADESGLSGFEAARGSAAWNPLPHEPLAWGEVARADQRVSCAGIGALVGLLGLGIAGGALGTEVATSGFGLDGGNSENVPLGFVIGFVAARPL